MTRLRPPGDRDWSDHEVETIVADYLEMLRKEQSGERYVKAEHRRALQRSLDNRSEGAIEMKHCNISAVLESMDSPYINAYKPRKNLQQKLRAAVEHRARRIQKAGNGAHER